ncbi:hypothetical protein LOZ01_006153 [Ophidiomyces ophidiicola]|nr:hypothetical protein LOZ01_006153 [Ophidiomyces ophidiicola]
MTRHMGALENQSQQMMTLAADKRKRNGGEDITSDDELSLPKNIQQPGGIQPNLNDAGEVEEGWKKTKPTITKHHNNTGPSIKIAGRAGKCASRGRPQKGSERSQTMPRVRKAKTKAQLTKERKDAQTELRTAIDKQKELHCYIQDLEETNRRLRQSFFIMKSHDNSRMISDEQIYKSFYALMHQCQEWSQRYSAETMPGPHCLSALHEAQDRIFAKSCVDFSNTLTFCEQQIRYGPFILLHMVLTHYICDRVIEEPFHYFRDEPKLATIPQLKDCLADIFPADYDHLARKWVGQTLQLYCPLSFPRQQPKTICPLERIKEHCYLNMASTFLDGPWKCLLKDISGQCEKRLTSLYRIFRAAGEAALMAWQQCEEFHCLSATSPKLVQNGFQNGSEFMRPHPGMRLKADDTALDRNKIEFVVTPAIVAYHSVDNFEKAPILWCQAIVWATTTHRNQLPAGSSEAKAQKLENCDTHKRIYAANSFQAESVVRSTPLHSMRTTEEICLDYVLIDDSVSDHMNPSKTMEKNTETNATGRYPKRSMKKSTSSCHSDSHLEFGHPQKDPSARTNQRTVCEILDSE